MRVFGVIAVTVSLTTAAVSAQSLAEIARSSGNRSPAKPSRVYTNDNIAPSDTPPPPPPVVITDAMAADPSRVSAIESLKAVRSALNGGANHQQFKDYFLKARVAVDALARLPENAPIREVADLYEDAATLMTAYITEEMSASVVSTLRARYAADRAFLNLFSDVSYEGFGRGQINTRFTIKSSAITCQAAGNWLMVRAAQRLDQLR